MLGPGVPSTPVRRIHVDEPKQREGDPDRRAGVKDPAGNTWWIATQVS
jgi:hypothetical protein